MRDFIVLVSAPDGSSRWVTVTAKDEAGARKVASQLGWNPVGVFTSIEAAQSTHPNDARITGIDPTEQAGGLGLPNFGTIGTAPGGAAVPPPGGGGEEEPFDFVREFPGAAFQRGLAERTGRTGQATNLLQRILESEFGQTQSAFTGSNIADLLGGGDINEVGGRSFQDFTARTGRADRSGLAQDILRRIGGAQNIERFLGGARGTGSQEFLRPTSARSAGGAINLLRDALRGKINPMLLGALPDTTQLFQEFRADPNIGLAPTGGNNIIDFLRKRFRTEQLGF